MPMPKVVLISPGVSGKLQGSVVCSLMAAEVLPRCLGRASRRRWSLSGGLLGLGPRGCPSPAWSLRSYDFGD